MPFLHTLHSPPTGLLRHIQTSLRANLTKSAERTLIKFADKFRPVRASETHFHMYRRSVEENMFSFNGYFNVNTSKYDPAASLQELHCLRKQIQEESKTY